MSAKTRTRIRLVQGVGVNDADYIVDKSHIEYVNGVRKKVFDFRCRYYAIWVEMLRRCYSEKFISLNPTYINVEVCSEWLSSFMAFRRWCIATEFDFNLSIVKQNLFLDKDVKFQGSKIYSPETCSLVTREVNNLLLTRTNARGGLPLGVYLHTSNKTFIAQCQLGTGSQNYLGTFPTAYLAHRAWQVVKMNHIISIAGKPENSHIRSALIDRANKLKSHLDNGLETIEL